jgi:hypothetical protein
MFGQALPPPIVTVSLPNAAPRPMEGMTEIQGDMSPE